MRNVRLKDKAIDMHKRVRLDVVMPPQLEVADVLQVLIKKREPLEVVQQPDRLVEDIVMLLPIGLEPLAILELQGQEHQMMQEPHALTELLIEVIMLIDRSVEQPHSRVLKL